MRGSRKICQRMSKFDKVFFFFFLFLVDKGIEDPNTIIMKWAISMAFRWQADNGPTLNAGLVAL